MKPQGQEQFASNKKLKQIKHIIMMGDSLSDRGTIDKKLLFGCIPMSLISELDGRSPDGRFTNGLVWSDHVTAEIASDFTIKRLQKKWCLDNTDIADAVIAHDKRVIHAIRNDYSLDDDQFVNYRGKVWVRSYCEGGLTSHDYSWLPSKSITRFFKRIILSTLADMRKKLISYDNKHQLSYEQKAQTLIIEWSGANDLVTVNAKPSIKEADDAIAARVDNVKKLIASGYRNFILFNLPNLALTPRYQAKTKAEQDEAQRCSNYFNAELQKACEAVSKDFPHCSIEVFDINYEFEKLYHDPEKYFFDKNKLKKAYTESVDFDDPSDGTSAATGYLFYDDIHPSADAHAILAAKFYEQLSNKYELLEPDKQLPRKDLELTEEVLVRCFRKHYQDQLTLHKNSFFCSSQKTKINYMQANLEEILDHALNEGEQRAREIITKLGWIDKEGRLALDTAVLYKAMENTRRHAICN